MLKPMAAMHSKFIKVHIMGQIRISYCWEGDWIIEILIDWFVPQRSPHTQRTAMSNVNNCTFGAGWLPCNKSISFCIYIYIYKNGRLLSMTGTPPSIKIVFRQHFHNFLVHSASMWLVLLFYATAENYGLQIVPFWLYLLVLLIFNSIWMQNPLSF